MAASISFGVTCCLLLNLLIVFFDVVRQTNAAKTGDGSKKEMVFNTYVEGKQINEVASFKYWNVLSQQTFLFLLSFFFTLFLLNFD